MAQNKGSIKVKSPGALNWFRNVGKSLGYTSADLVEEILPASMEFARSNAQTITELTRELRGMKSSNKRLSDILGVSDQIDIAQDAWKNALADIKSGKLYNKERQEASYNDGMDDFMLSDDFDFKEDGFDVNVDSKQSDSGKVTNLIKVDSNINRNNPMVKAVEQQSKIMVQSNKAMADVSISLAAQKMAVDKRMGTAMMQGLDAINSNLSLLVNFQNESMTKYVGASLKYYEESLKTMNDTLVELKKVSTPQGLGDRSKAEDPMDMALLSRGGLNLKGYGQLIWKQLGNAIQGNMFLAPIKAMLDDKDTLKFMAASPLSFISTKMVSFLIPNMLKKAMEDMDKTFSNFFPAILMKANKLSNSDNPILQLIGQIFGVNVKSKTSVDLSQYDKGPVPFDGYARQALVHVIPTYLRKMLAALTGKEEMAYDAEKGTFKSVSSMKKEFQDTERLTVLNEFSEILGEIKDRAKAFQIENEEDRKKFNNDLEDWFMNLSQQSDLINPRKRRNRNGDVLDDLKSTYQFQSGSEYQEFFNQLFLSLPKGMQMKGLSTDLANARRARMRMMDEAEQNQSKFNAANIWSWDADQHLEKDKYKENKMVMKKDWGGAFGADRYNHNATDYLRDIKGILMKGIVVFPNYQYGGGSGGTGGSFTNPYQSKINAMDKEVTDYKRPTPINTNTTDPATYDSRLGRGQRTVTTLAGSHISPQEMADQINVYTQERDKTPSDDEKDNVFKWVGKFFKGDTKQKYDMLRERVEKLLQTPAKILKGVFERIDDTMYRIVFGDGDDENASFMSKTWATVKLQFKKMGDWMKKDVIDPIHESLFGKDGIITRMKDSEFYKNLKSKMGSMADYLFGKPTGENGKREGGLMSDSANEMIDMWKGAKYYFTGKSFTNSKGETVPDNPNSVFGELKGMFKGFKDNVKGYLFGRKGENEADPGEKGILSGVIGSIKDGFQNFSDAMFGPKMIGGKVNKNYIAIDEMTKTVKERAPKALATGIIGAGAGLMLGGKLGLLGSIFLPGGPLGGAIVGTTLGFLSQSDKFKDWLFGPMATDENGVKQRIGGFMSKNTQEFLKKNRAGIIGGATLGAARSALGFGLLPSFFLPGGPIGGAVLGMGVSMLTRSEGFQKMMFGEEKDGKRTGGVVNKLFGAFREDGNGKKVFGNIAAGSLGGATLGLVTSKLGLMGAMLLPGGPVGGALLGAAAGIALSSDKWKKALFGEFDEDTQLRKGGLFGKFINWTKLEIFAPLKLQFKEMSLNMREWFTKSIANPFANAIEPIKHEIKLAIKGIKEGFMEGWDQFKNFLGTSFEKFVGMPFGRFMEDKVLNPLKGFMTKILGGIGKIVGGILSAPFKGLEGFSRGLTKKHMQQGLEAYVEEGWSNLLDFKGRRQRGEKLGFKGAVKGWWDIYFNRGKRKDARYGPNGAPYAAELEASRQRRTDEANSKYGAERSALDAERDALNARRGRGRGYDYENLVYDADGNPVDVTDTYKTHDTDGQRSPVEESTQKIGDKTGINKAVNNGDGTSSSNNVIDLDSRRQQKDNNNDTKPGATPVGPSANADTTNKPKQFTVVQGGKNNKNTDKETSSTASNQSGSSSSDNKGGSGVTATPVGRKEIGGSGKGKDGGGLLKQIAADVRIIAQEVKGQLDGVGSNVFKMRKLMQKQTGASDDDIAGSANRDRIGFFGKIRRAMQNPLDWMKEQLSKPIKWVSDQFGKVTEKIKQFGGFLISIPKKIGTAIVDFGKELWGIGKETFLTLVKLPGTIFKTLQYAAQGFAETLKAVGPAIGESLKGVAKLFSGTMGMVAHSLIGFGQGLGEIFLGFGQGVGTLLLDIGQGVGGAIKGMTTAMFKAVPIVTDFLMGTAKSIADFTLNTITTVGEKLMDVGNTLFEIVTSPLKFLSGAIGKLVGWKSEVVVAGGTLDKVREVDVIHIIDGEMPKGLSIGTARTKAEPTDVRIVGVTDAMPVYLTPDRIANSFAKIIPLPVKIVDTATSASPTEEVVAAKQTAIIPGAGLIAQEMATALQAEDKRDDREETAKAQDKAEDAARQAAQKAVSQKTAKNLQAAVALRQEKEDEKLWKTDMLSTLHKLTGSTVEHNTDWGKIFGSKGLVTLALLAALPFLKDILKWLFGQGNNGRMDVGGSVINNSDLGEHLVRGIGYGLKQGMSKLFQSLGAHWNSIQASAAEAKRLWLEAAEHSKKIWTKIADKTSEQWGKMTEKLGGAWDNFFRKYFPEQAAKAAEKKAAKTAAKDVASKAAKEAAEKAGEGGAKSGGRLQKAFDKFMGYKMEDPAAKLGDELAENGSKIINPAARIGEQTGASAIQTAAEQGAKKTGAKVIDFAASKAAKESGETGAKIAVESTVETVQNSRIAKFIEMSKEAVHKVVGIFEKKFPKASKAAAPIMEVVLKVLTPVKLLKFTPKIAAGLAKIGAAAATLLASDVAWATWGGVTGAFEAAHLFKVPGDQVDWIMRTISAGMKALLSVSWFFVIEILNDICVEITGLDFLQIAASQVYKAVTSDEKGAKLEAAQADFKNDLEEYNRMNGTNLSLDAYNDKMNKTIGQRIGDAFSWTGQKLGNAWNATKQGFSWMGQKIGEKATQFGNWAGEKAGQFGSWASEKGRQIGQGLNSARQFIGQKANQFGNWALNKGQQIGQGLNAAGQVIGNAASQAWDATKKGAKAAWNNSALGATINGYNNTDMIKENLGIKGDGKVTNLMKTSSAASETIEKLSMGLIKSEKSAKLIYGMGVTMGEYWEKAKTFVDDSIVKPAQKAWADAKEAINKKLTEFSQGAKQVWGEITQGIQKEWEGFKKSMDELLGPWVEGAKKLWSDITTGISDGWNSAKEFIGGKVDEFKKNASDKWTELTTNIANGWASAKETVGGKVEEMKKAASDKWTEIRDNVSEKWQNTKDAVNDRVTSIKEGASTKWAEIRDNISDTWTATRKSILDFKDNIVSETKKKWDEMTAPIVETWEGIKSSISDGLGKIKSKFQNIGNNISKPFTAIYNFFTGKANSSLDDLGWDTGNGDFNPWNMMKRPAKPSAVSQQGGMGIDPDRVNNFAYYSQADDRWANSRYDHSPSVGFSSSNPTLKARGCGPTSMAMVLTQLTGQRYEPPQLAQLAERGGYSVQAGTSWSFFDRVAKDFNLQMNKVPSATNGASIQNWLAQGIPVIMSGTRTHSASESPFTTGGHFVVAVGNDGPGRIIINDPRGAQYSKSYDLNTVLSESKMSWAFKYGGGPIPAATPGASVTGAVSDAPLSVIDLFGKMGQNFNNYIDNVYQGTNKQLEWTESGLSMPGDASAYAKYQPLGDPYGQANRNLGQFNPISEKELNDWIAAKAPANSPFRGQGKVFLEASKQSGLDPRYLVAHAALESTWGTSNIARAKNNYFGIGAFNDSPMASALSFDTGLASGIVGGANWISKNYTKAGQNTLNSMIYGNPSHRYAVYDDGRPNSGWISSIAQIMSTAPKGGETGGFGNMMDNMNRMFDPSAEGGLGELTQSLNDRFNTLMTNDGKLKADGVDFSSLRDNPDVRAIISSGNKDCMSDELLKQAIGVLQEISDHTGSTSEGIKELAKKEIKVEVKSSDIQKSDSSNSQNTANVIVSPDNNNTYLNPMIEMANQRRNAKQEKDYNVAKTIAKGRLY